MLFQRNLKHGKDWTELTCYYVMLWHYLHMVGLRELTDIARGKIISEEMVSNC